MSSSTPNRSVGTFRRLVLPSNGCPLLVMAAPPRRDQTPSSSAKTSTEPVASPALASFEKATTRPSRLILTLYPVWCVKRSRTVVSKASFFTHASPIAS